MSQPNITVPQPVPQPHEPFQPIPIPLRHGPQIVDEATEAMIKSNKQKHQSQSDLEEHVAALEEEAQYHCQLIKSIGMHADLA